MSTDSEHIQELLERYYQAETSLEEERQLRAWFGDRIPEGDMALHAAVLQAHDEFRAMRSREQFASDILTRIEQDKPVRRLPVRQMLAYAATLALVVAAGWWFLTNSPATDHSPSLTEDTFEDPAEAMQELEAALQLISTHFSQGLFMTIESLEPIEELDILIQ